MLTGYYGYDGDDDDNSDDDDGGGGGGGDSGENWKSLVPEGLWHGAL